MSGLRTAIQIAGAGHSGSTLLGLLLDGHPDVFYVGESRKVRFLGRDDVPLRKRSCRFCGADCPFWSRFRWQPSDGALYTCLAEKSDRSVIVDSTKNVEWIAARLEETRLLGIEPTLVLLVRDGRAVVASRMRKYPDQTAIEVIDEWVAHMRATLALVANNATRSVVIRYESLATDPRGTLEALCADVGLAFDETMLDYAGTTHHILGGNSGTRALARRDVANDGEITPTARSFYVTHPGDIRIDERWHNELGDEVLSVFESRAGAMQRMLERL